MHLEFFVIRGRARMSRWVRVGARVSLAMVLYYVLLLSTAKYVTYHSESVSMEQTEGFACHECTKKILLSNRNGNQD